MAVGFKTRLVMIILLQLFFASGVFGDPICYEESIWSRIIKTLLFIPTMLNLLLSKLAAFIAGLFFVLLSLIPIPRFTQWCPPTIAIFDTLIAICVGIIFYVLILWAVAGESDDDDDGSLADNKNFHPSRPSRGSKNRSMTSESTKTNSESLIDLRKIDDDRKDPDETDASWKKSTRTDGSLNESANATSSWNNLAQDLHLFAPRYRGRQVRDAENELNEEEDGDGREQSRYGQEMNEDGREQSFYGKKVNKDGREQSRLNGTTQHGVGEGKSVTSELSKESIRSFFRNNDLVGLMYRAI